MRNDLYTSTYNPDVLSCIANLSNDEVFTPPEVANAMLDLLPQELFRDPNTKFLDPACKSGVFLREIAKRLLVGLEDQIPDLQQRVDHIFHQQLCLPHGGGGAVDGIRGQQVRAGADGHPGLHRPAAGVDVLPGGGLLLAQVPLG